MTDLIAKAIETMALIDRLKYDFSSDELVYKWPAEGLTTGTQLIVSEGQQALFLKGGQALDLFDPGTHTLSSANLPLLQKLVNLPFGGKTPFSAEIYFINKTVAFAQDWGTRTPILLPDPRYKVAIPLRGYGQYAIRIENAREFITHVVGSSGQAFSNSTASAMLASPILTCIQQSLGDYLVQKRITALELPAHVLKLCKHVIELLRTEYRSFGVELINFTIESINFDSADESVGRLRAMIDEAARLDVIGDAFRRNQDFYRTERQFDVLQSGADSEGGGESLIGAALGIGMGFGVAKPAAEIARRAMAPVPNTELCCAKCNAVYQPGAKVCNECGSSLSAALKTCRECFSENVSTAKFCITCGFSFALVKCKSCSASLANNAKFCNECGDRV